MEVYVLLGQIDYEGDCLLGVYHSQADAEYHRDLYKARVSLGYDDYEIQRRVVGARARSGWESEKNNEA